MFIGKYNVTPQNPQVFNSNDKESLTKFLHENGYVVVDNVSSKKNRDKLVELMNNLPDEAKRLAFLDLYHDDTLAQLRQDNRLVDVFTNIFNTEDLWVIFDRVIKQSVDDVSNNELPAHVDQNPLTHPDFCNVQAMLALRDMDETSGTLAIVPKSQRFFNEYSEWTPSEKAGYVEYGGDRDLHFVALRLKEGQFVIWDSRTTHSRFRSNEPKKDRYAALISYKPVIDNDRLRKLRRTMYEKGIGHNNHDAGLRATANPRYPLSLRQNPEIFTELGKKIYDI